MTERLFWHIGAVVLAFIGGYLYAKEDVSPWMVLLFVALFMGRAESK